MVNHTYMAFPCRFVDSLDPLDHFLSFDVSWTIPKNMWKFLYGLLNLLSCIYAGLTSKTAYIRMCTKVLILLEFPLTWIWLTCLLAFHMPWDRWDSTFHYPIEKLYKEPLGYIEGGGIEEQENYSPLLLELILESASLCPFEHFFVLPKLSFCLWSFYWEMEDWSGGGPSGELSFSNSQTCWQRLSIL